jgi:hypothetical protein
VSALRSGRTLAGKCTSTCVFARQLVHFALPVTPPIPPIHCCHAPSYPFAASTDPSSCSYHFFSVIVDRCNYLAWPAGAHPSSHRYPLMLHVQLSLSPTSSHFLARSSTHTRVDAHTHVHIQCKQLPSNAAVVTASLELLRFSQASSFPISPLLQR